MGHILEDHLPDHEAHARYSSHHHCTGCMERRYDAFDHHGWYRTEHTASGTA